VTNMASDFRLSLFTFRFAATAAASLAAAPFIGGCAAPRVNTTMLTIKDIVSMTDQMAQSLAASPVIASRAASSPRWVFTMDKVSNRTEHLLDDQEKWGTMARFRAELSRSFVARERNIAFVLPAEQWKRYAAGGDYSEDQARLRPTHALRAEFRSDTRSALLSRSDHYLCAFQLLDLNDGAIVWENAYEVKYAVKRNEFD